MFHVILSHYLCTNVNELHENVNSKAVLRVTLLKKTSQVFNISIKPTRLIFNYGPELPLKPQVWRRVIKICSVITELCLRTLQYIALALLIYIHKVLGLSPCPDSGSPGRCSS
jgi:hypothetical protein